MLVSWHLIIANAINILSFFNLYLIIKCEQGIYEQVRFELDKGSDLIHNELNREIAQTLPEMKGFNAESAIDAA